MLFALVILAVPVYARLHQEECESVKSQRQSRNPASSDSDRDTLASELKVRTVAAFDSVFDDSFSGGHCKIRDSPRSAGELPLNPISSPVLRAPLLPTPPCCYLLLPLTLQKEPHSL